MRGQINRLIPWSRHDSDSSANDNMEASNGAYVSMNDDGVPLEELSRNP